MFWKQAALYFFVLLCTLSDAGHATSRTKRTDEETDAVKVLREIDNVLEKNYAVSKNAEIPTNCPTPGGVVHVEGVNLPGSQGGLANLMFMCGTTQESYEVPVRWVLHPGPSGSTINVTIYETRYRAVPLCCPGYIRNSDDICVPKCKNNCPNGLCVSPDKCTCYQGYTLNGMGQCVLTCPCGCPNGECTGDVCKCDSGYALDETKKLCNPVCRKKCVNADCTGPNNCTCYDGYVRKNKFTCEPFCSNGCEHGNCTGPDICVCLDGYYRQNNTGKCVPRCYGCEHGDCVAPYKCHCHKGYQRVDEVCKPVCNEGCINATCTSPNFCSCYSGYTKITAYICSPKCSPKCKNARCVAPDTCECYSGFIKDPKPFHSHICKSPAAEIISSIGNLINDIKH